MLSNTIVLFFSKSSFFLLIIFSSFSFSNNNINLADKISSELRCLVCQNQTVYESNSEFAVDIKKNIKKLLDQGKNESEVLSHMVDRYGYFILYNPPLLSSTYVLWIGPFVIFFLFSILTFLYIRKRNMTLINGKNKEKK